MRNDFIYTPISFRKYEYIEFDNAKWLKIFHHKVSDSNDFYTDINSYLSSNSPNVFSILGDYAFYPRYNLSNYEFLLYYPEHEGYNRWLQSNFPLEEEDTWGKTQADGFINISCDWNYNLWGGLVKTDLSDCSLIDGSFGHGFVFYSIGFKQNCGQYGITNFPSFNDTATEVFLWVRVKNIYLGDFHSHLSCQKSCNLNIYIIIIIIVR